MSRGKNGPSLPELPEGRAYLSSPGDRAAGGRVFSMHVRHSNIRAWPSRLRISLLRLGASRRNRSLSTGVAVSPPPKKELEWPPNGLERGARRGRTLCPGTAARYAAAIPAIAHTQHAISRAVAQLALGDRSGQGQTAIRGGRSATIGTAQSYPRISSIDTGLKRKGRPRGRLRMKERATLADDSNCNGVKP